MALGIGAAISKFEVLCTFMDKCLMDQAGLAEAFQNTVNGNFIYVVFA